MLARIILTAVVLVAACVPAAGREQTQRSPRSEAPPAPLAPLAAEALAAEAVSPPKVTAVVPEANASAVSFDSAVFVQFNQPVVPLTALGALAPESVIDIDPPTNGTARWINTGLLTFSPALGWAGAKTYHVSIPNTHYTWSFSTLPPAVASTSPPAGAKLVDPRADIRITFNHPVDPSTVRLTLSPSTPGTLAWSDTRTLVFHPDDTFAEGTTIDAEAQVDLDVEGAPNPYTWKFSTAPSPTLVRSVPDNGGQSPRSGQVELFFTAPMDRDELRANLQLEPQLDYPPYLSWSDDDTHVTLFGAFALATHYLLRIPSTTTDRFHRQLDLDVVVQFQTPATPVSPNAPPVRPQAWLVSPGPIGTYNAYEHPRALLRTTNVTRFTYSLDALDEPTAVQLADRRMPGPMPDGARLSDGTIAVESERNVPTLTSIDLGQLEPGYYRLRVDPEQLDARVPDHLLVVTHTMLAVKEANGQILVWATDLNSGAPLPNVPVRVLQPGSPATVMHGTTAADGTVLLSIPRATKPETLVVIVDRPGDAALALSTWSGGVGSWTFGLQSAFTSQDFAAHVYTDRPIYRPGQTVHFKGIVRGDDDARYWVPDKLSATWQAQDSQGRAISAGTVDRLSDFGTFAADVDLSTEAATGTYSFNLKMGDQSLASAAFVVAEYQRPDFEVNLALQDAIVGGQPLSPSLRAAYYFGQALVRAPVHWQVIAEPFSFSWPSDPTFRFGDQDAGSFKTSALGKPANAPRAEGQGRTGTDGAFTFQVPTDLNGDLSSQRLTVEASVTDPDQREASNRLSVVVHKAGLYIGLKPTTFVAQAGIEQAVRLVTLDISGTPRPNVAVHGQLVRRRWLSVRERDAQGELRWISRPEDTPVESIEARSGVDGRGSFNFRPSEGGEYRLIVEAEDGAGNVARTAIGVWVAGSGSGFVPWRINDDARLELQADRPAYQPGEVAHVIVPAPVADATALITIERGKVISHSVQHLVGNSAVVDIPIGTQHVPNAYVSVVLFGGGKSEPVYSGYVELPVSSKDRQLQLTVEPDRRDHAPGDAVSFSIHTRDASGRGTPAEVSLALVDAAVLALADSRSDPVMAFWHRRPLGVRTGTSLGVSIDRLNDTASSGLKGGGGGDQSTVRQDFPDTAFWQPSLLTNAVGEAHVDVRLPDTLTTWRLTAVGVTRDTRLAVATTEVVTGKPLLIRPLTTRFLVGGDVATVGAAVHNTTSAALSVTASLSANGLQIQGDAKRSIQLPAGGQARLDWPVTSLVGLASKATLHFEAASSGVGDAVEVSLPLLAWGAPETIATAGEVAAADLTTELVEVSKEVDRQRGELRVDVAPSLAAALSYSLRQVEEYPYECLEQTVSRFVPRLALARAIEGLGLPDPLGLKGELPGLVTRSIERMYRYQHADGGWGWWRDDVSQPYLTAYAVFGLVEARRAGFAVDQGVVNRGAAFLRQWLNADPGPFGLDTRAYVVSVLGQAGSAEPSRAAALFDRRADLGPTARAYLAQALATINPSDSRVGGLLAELTSAAVVSTSGSHWEEPNPAVKPWIMGTSVRTTAAVLDALVRLRPDHPLITSSVRWLMAARRDSSGAWETTHDTANSLLALTDYLSTSGELQGSFEWQVGVNGQTRRNGAVVPGAGVLSASHLAIPLPDLKVGQNQVDLIRSVGGGRLYYTLQLRTFAQAEGVSFVNHGFSLGREYLAADANGSSNATPLKQVHVGDLVQVRLTLIAPSELHDVVIEDPLPAGLEPIDTRLKTTSQAAKDALTAARAPGWQPWTHVDVRSDKVALFANFVGKGAHQYVYLARASIPGEFRVLPTSGREQYFPEVNARGDGRRFTILP